MINMSNVNAQVLQPGQAITFDKVTLKTRNGAECHNQAAPSTVKLCSDGIYDISFSGNITGAAGATLQIAIAAGGYPLVDTAMNATPAAENQLVNVFARKLLHNCCCDLNRISVVNTGSVPVTIAPNSSLVIIRES